MKQLREIFGYLLGFIMSFQVASEEKRLERDFGQEYLDYKKRTGRFTPW